MERDHLTRRTVRKLDFVLLPFLALLFLFNSLDRSNIGNAETAHFTSDIGLAPGDLNTAVAVFFAFFVALQPVGAALGRRYGMAIWVPACMTIWGLCTILHVWVRTKWQLVTLRIVIGSLEAGFYPVTVSYLSLFYTRYEFAKRLGLFYGQYAIAGALGSILSYFVFSRFPSDHHDGTPDEWDRKSWRSWQVLFFLEGAITVVIALVGFFWLPQSARTAWFLRKDEREWAEERIRLDLASSESTSKSQDVHQSALETEETEFTQGEESRGLLSPPLDDQAPSRRYSSPNSNPTSSLGLSPHDVVSAFTSPYLWSLLFLNILSSIPVTAFSVFLPLVLSHLNPDPNNPSKSTPALTNLLSAPPFLCGALTLYLFTTYSDRTHLRLIPILYALLLLVAGLTLVVVLPASWPIPRYLALCLLLSGSFIPSPLIVAWLTNNTPSPGKRAILLGINGWGNLAGVFSALLFQPKYGPRYAVPFVVTVVAVSVAAVGFAVFRWAVARVNAVREREMEGWKSGDVEVERRFGEGPALVGRRPVWDAVVRILAALGEPGLRARMWLEEAGKGREGDERVTFRYGL
ncbi:MFS general substrate transporter [Aulographum hederae CBS 113979]|uniref:MFS general substrate transporter n=1 Tax=Aulographum hederae CBS 113979 TaxID=1176131 RepID=A0A6G1GX59_9PEZI|nr:MFS general substrate transporter [Aulographum hederae CBS 113979]